MAADLVVFLSTQNAGNDLRPQRGDIIDVFDSTGVNPAGAVPPLFGVVEITNMGRGQVKQLKAPHGNQHTDPDTGEGYYTLIQKRRFYVNLDSGGFPDLPGLEAGRTAMTKQALGPFVIDKVTGQPVVL